MTTLESFNEVNKNYRPAPFWSWNDKLNKDELLFQMNKMKEAGYGGFFMHSRVGLVTPYLKKEWFDLIDFCAEKAKKLGLVANIYDEDMWPSGYCSGLVPASNDDYREKALICCDESKIRSTDIIYKRFNSKCIAFRRCEKGMTRFANETYIDTLNPKAVKCFIDNTHELYKKNVGKYFGKTIKSMFTDEPCYGIHWFYDVPHVPYSEYLRDKILKEKGYDILEVVESLFFNVGDYLRIRSDYYSLAGNLLAESFTKQYADWCEKNNLKMTGHFMAEESLYEQTEWTGGVMQNYAIMQEPGIDKLQRINNQLLTIKQLTSVTEQLDKPVALAESFAGIGHDSGILKRKQIVDWLSVNGITFINAHLSHYSLRGERKRDYPPTISYQQPYFKEEKVFSDYCARVSQLAKCGNREVKILVIEPLNSLFGHYNPNEINNKDTCKKFDETLSNVINTLQKNHIDFHIGDENIIKQYGSVKNKLLTIGNYSYDVVILPEVESLNLKTVNLLKKHIGEIIAIGQKPRFIEYKNELVLDSVELINQNDLVRHLGKFKITKIVNSNVIVSKRVDENGEYYLFANTGNKNEKINLGEFKDSYVLDLTKGCAYKLTKLDVLINKSGSIALFKGNASALKKFGIRVMDLPTHTEDGCEFGINIKNKLNCRFDIKAKDENALVIDRCDFITDEKCLKNVPLCSIWHYEFYKLKDGTKYKLRYYFNIAQMPEANPELVIENAENLDYITLNGTKVKPLRKKGEIQVSDDKCYKDISFTRCKALGFKLGRNVIEIEGTKVNNITEVCNHRHVTEKTHNATEAEIIYLVGEFALDKKNRIIKQNKLTIGDISRRGYQFYSGELTYQTEVELDGKSSLVIEGDAVTMSLEIGGKKFVSYRKPFVFDLRGIKGKFDIKVNLLNSLFPLLGPHHIKGYDQLIWVDPGIFNDLRRYDKNYLIKPYGLKNISLTKQGE